MKIKMAGIDFISAKLKEREKFSFTPLQTEYALTNIRDRHGVKGCVLLSTCNRTELWVSEDDGVDHDPFALLLKEKGVWEQKDRYSDYFTVREDAEAITHLFETACGLRSQVIGEDQILAQVKSAIDLARASSAADEILEKLFQTAVASAKKVKTNVRLTTADASVAHSAIHKAREYVNGLHGAKCLVIGNGEMGRLAAKYLVEQGAEVSITFRQFKPGQKNPIPPGCKAVGYEERYNLIPQCDIILSATISPHYTVTKEDTEAIASMDKRFVFVDLAVPRDIDKGILDYPNTFLIDMDSIGTNLSVGSEALKEAERIISEYIQDFYKWHFSRKYYLKKAANH